MSFSVTEADVSAPGWVDDVEVPAGDPDDASNSNVLPPGSEIVLEASASAWSGVAPEQVPEEGNPTLVLQAGAEYALRWEHGDGLLHNIEIRDENGTVVGGLETPETAEPDEFQYLEFVASAEMAAYVCALHSNRMAGRIVVE